MGTSALPVARGRTLFQAGRAAEREIALDTPAWFAWLEQADAFAYQWEGVRLTIRKEPRPRGRSYWRACQKYGARLYRVYLGTSRELKAAKLASAARTFENRIAQRLNGTSPCGRRQRGRRRPSRLSLPLQRSAAPALGRRRAARGRRRTRSRSNVARLSGSRSRLGGSAPGAVVTLGSIG